MRSIYKYFENKVFNFVTAFTRAKVESQYSYLNPNNGEQVMERLKVYKEAEALQRAETNLSNSLRVHLTPVERAEYDALRDYFEENDDINARDPQALREKLGAIRLVAKLEELKAREKDVDPEIIEFETLKANFLLDKPESREKFMEYVKNRPYLREFRNWADEAERTQIKVWPLI